MAGVVVGVDGSAHAQRALEWAVEEAELRGCPLLVLAVQPIPQSLGWGAVPLQVYPEKEDRLRVETGARRAPEKVTAERGRGLSVDATVQGVIGNPIDELLAASKHAEPVVVGSRGAGGFRPAPVGLGPAPPWCTTPTARSSSSARRESAADTPERSLA